MDSSEEPLSAEDTFARKLNNWTERDTLPLNIPSDVPSGNLFMDFINASESNPELRFGDYHNTFHKSKKVSEQ